MHSGNDAEMLERPHEQSCRHEWTYYSCRLFVYRRCLKCGKREKKTYEEAYGTESNL